MLMTLILNILDDYRGSKFVIIIKAKPYMDLTIMYIFDYNVRFDEIILIFYYSMVIFKVSTPISNSKNYILKYKKSI
jgi:hypothetical protein